MNREELFEQIKPYAQKYIDGFYDEKFEGANIRRVITIAEQYAKSKVSELKAENERLTNERSVRMDMLEGDLDKCKTLYADAIELQRKQAKEIDRLKAENEKLRECLKNFVDDYTFEKGDKFYCPNIKQAKQLLNK